MLIADRLDVEIRKRFEGKSILVRATQSGNYALNRPQLIRNIVAHGGDHVFRLDGEMPHEMHATNFEPWTEQSTALGTFKGFHKFKPKSDERPHHPADIWMVFDANMYENVEYLHPRHQVMARDKWRVKSPGIFGLQVVFVVN